MRKPWLKIVILLVVAFTLIGFFTGWTRAREARHARAEAYAGRLSATTPRDIAARLSFDTVDESLGRLALSYRADARERGPDARRDACAQPLVREALANGVPVDLVLLGWINRQTLDHFELVCEPR